MKKLPLLALALFCACTSRVQLVDSSAVEEIPEEAALNYLRRPFDESGVFYYQLVRPEGLISIKSGGKKIIPWADLRLVKAYSSNYINKRGLKVVLEGGGEKILFARQHCHSASACFDGVEERVRRIVQALAALGVRIK